MAVLDKKKSKVSDKVPSSSMADIAFLLLIFFLVTTTFPKNKGLAIVLPEEGGEVEVSPRNILHIIIQPNGLVDVKRGESQAVQTVAPLPSSTRDAPLLPLAVDCHPGPSPCQACAGA